MDLDYSQQVDRYVFRKPLWRKLFPPFLIALVWLLPAFLWKGSLLVLPEPFSTWPTTTLAWLARFGITLDYAVIGAGILTALLVMWWYTGFGILVISADAITRSGLLGFRNSLRWVDVDEVLIDHVEARMEGDATARKTLHLYELPKGIFRTRKKMTISNRQFDGFEDVERIAVMVSVPAVAERLRMKIGATRKAAVFPFWSGNHTVAALISLLFGIGLIALSFYQAAFIILMRLVTFFPPQYINTLPIATLVLGVLIVMGAIWKFFYKQLGVDLENLYIMRRGWITRKIPIDNIADIQIRDNQMRIYAFTRDPEVPRQVFKTNEYVRNRGVFLRLVRDQYDARRAQDNAPIPAVRHA